RTAFAVGVESVHPAEISLPFQLTIQIQTIEAARTEKGVNSFTIGDGRIGSETTRFMAALVRPLFTQDLLPRNFPIPAADREGEKLVAMSHRNAVVNAGGVIENRLLGRTGRRCREGVDPIAGDNG